MILTCSAAVSPRRCRANNVNCVCRAAESVSYRRWSEIAGFGARLAMGCNGRLFYRNPPVLPCVVSLRWRPLSALVRRPLLRCYRYFAYTGGCKVSAASPLTQKPDQARRRFQARYAGLYRHDWLGVINGNASAETGANAMLFGVGFGLLIERAQICFTSAFRDLWISGRAHMATIIFGMAVSTIEVFFSYVRLGRCT